jgi:hypothetical protein
MGTYIYFTVNPEAIIASMLPPKEFGLYLSTGTKSRNHCQVIFFEVNPDGVKEMIDVESVKRRCVAKPDGSPKSSVYLTVYRVLEKLPLSALKSLYLTTEHGCSLEIKKAYYNVSNEIPGRYHLYQELCPVTPLIASEYTPSVFLKHLTDGSTSIALPKLFFVELKLGELAENPLAGSVEYLPYANIGNLRDCFEIIKTEEDKHMKTVQRIYSGALLYRTIENGFYIGANSEFLFYPYPSMAELENSNYEFFRAI